jgi:DNA-binding transcriptional regulator YiaG
MTGAELKAWREQRRLSQPELAERLPVSVRTLQGWEQDRFAVPAYLERALQDVERELSGNPAADPAHNPA